MSDRELWLVATTFAILVAAVLFYYLGWLGKGKVRAVVLFLAGAGMIASLHAAGIPPDWFEGGAESLGLIFFFLGTAFISDKGEARSFGRPLCLGMGLSLTVLAIAAHL